MDAWSFISVSKYYITHTYTHTGRFGCRPKYGAAWLHPPRRDTGPHAPGTKRDPGPAQTSRLQIGGPCRGGGTSCLLESQPSPVKRLGRRATSRCTARVPDSMAQCPPGALPKGQGPSTPWHRQLPRANSWLPPRAPGRAQSAPHGAARRGPASQMACARSCRGPSMRPWAASQVSRR